MAICSGRRKPVAYDGDDFDIWFKKYMGGLNPELDGYFNDLLVDCYESCKNSNDLSSKTVIDNTFLPVFRKPYQLDSDDWKDS